MIDYSQRIIVDEGVAVSDLMAKVDEINEKRGEDDELYPTFFQISNADFELLSKLLMAREEIPDCVDTKNIGGKLMKIWRHYGTIFDECRIIPQTMMGLKYEDESLKGIHELMMDEILKLKEGMDGDQRNKIIEAIGTMYTKEMDLSEPVEEQKEEVKDDSGEG